MRILITGAEVEKQGSEYQVVYQGKVVFKCRIKDVAIVTALNQETLDKLLAKQT